MYGRQNKSNKNKYITEVIAPIKTISTAGETKSFIGKGDSNAIFSVQVRRTSAPAELYNFETDLFSATITSKSRLKNQRPGSFGIILPSNASGDTYTVEIFAEPHFNTQFSFGRNPYRYAFNLTQSTSNVTVTFKTTALGKATTTTLDTFTGISSSSNAGEGRLVRDKQLSFTSHNDDYGLVITHPFAGDDDQLTGTWDNSALYFETTEDNVGGTASDSNQVEVADLTELAVGMELTYITGTTAPGSATTITAIDTATKTLTLSRDQAITGGHTMTFRAYGSKVINDSVGINCTVKYATVRIEPVSTTVRTALTGDNATIDVNGTGGFGVAVNGNGIAVTLNSSVVQNNEDALVTRLSGVSGHTTQGTLTLANAVFGAEFAEIGTIIYAVGSSNKIYISADIILTKYPSANKDIFFDLSKVFTAGANS